MACQIPRPQVAPSQRPWPLLRSFRAVLVPGYRRFRMIFYSSWLVSSALKISSLLEWYAPAILTRLNRTEISPLFTDIKALYLSHQAALGMVRCPQIPCHRQEITRASIHRRSQISLRQGTGSASDTCFQIPQKLVFPKSTVQEKCRFPHQRTDHRRQFFIPTFQRSPTPHFPGPFPVRLQWRTPYYGRAKSCRLLGDSF